MPRGTRDSCESITLPTWGFSAGPRFQASPSVEFRASPRYFLKTDAPDLVRSQRIRYLKPLASPVRGRIP
jgi:hypothetical protein